MTTPGRRAAALRNGMAQPATDPRVPAAAMDYHRRLPGYAPTPLVPAPAAAEAIGAAAVWVKNESSRLGLPSYKVLGASWAAYRLLERRRGSAFDTWRDVDELRTQLESLRPLTLVAATDGNHGRAVARIARWFGLDARILIPAGTHERRITAIRDEGADVVIVDGTYDRAVELAADAATSGSAVVVTDTAWGGHDDSARWVVEGYGTMFAEITEQLAAAGSSGCDVVAAQMGVGSLACAAIEHTRRPGVRVVGVEPTTAACIFASLQAGELVRIDATHDSRMAGLNCGTPSEQAWPTVRAGLDVAVTVDDAYADDAVALLAEAGVVAGESGAAGLAGLLALASDETLADAQDAAGLSGATVLCINTEGTTDR